MGVDVTAYSMFGVEAESFENACQMLLDLGIISKQDYNDCGDVGEVCGNSNYEYQTYSCYSECGGVLGIYIDAQDMYKAPEECNKMMGQVKEHFPEATFHLFCQWN